MVTGRLGKSEFKFRIQHATESVASFPRNFLFFTPVTSDFTGSLDCSRDVKLHTGWHFYSQLKTEALTTAHLHDHKWINSSRKLWLAVSTYTKQSKWFSSEPSYRLSVCQSASLTDLASGNHADAACKSELGSHQNLLQ